MATTGPFYLRRRSFGGWHVHDAATDKVIGWVVKNPATTRWVSYVAGDWDGQGRWVGAFDNRRGAVDEVWIQREV